MATAAWPVAPAPAWTTTVSPGVIRPKGLSAARAVGQFTTRPSACSGAQPAGTGTAAAAGRTTYSAKAPSPTPTTTLPGPGLVTPSPTARTSPAASKPATNGGSEPPRNVP